MFYDFDRTFNVIDQLRREMDRAFDRDHFEPLPEATLADAGAELVLEIELPGVADKDVELTIHQDTLAIRGEKKSDAPEGYVAHRRERPPIKFERTIALPAKVDPDRSSATLKNGVMTVKLTKVPDAQPRRISVNASN
jgi:HSP20 family protein